jgi:hypothetical protein
MNNVRAAPEFVYATCGASCLWARAPGAPLATRSRIPIAPSSGDVE